MAMTWQTFEERVRTLAQYIWGKPCAARRLGGVNIDGFVQIEPGTIVLIEITEERDLGKIRGDVNKLITAKVRGA
jgi:hypothetical protein